MAVDDRLLAQVLREAGHESAAEAVEAKAGDTEPKKDPDGGDRLARIETALDRLVGGVERRDPEAAARAEGQAILDTMNEQLGKTGSNWVKPGGKEADDGGS